jgi:hypothetical protein
MNQLRKAVRDYVTMRRHLGYKLRRAPVLLNDFVGFLQKQKAGHVTVSLALQWAQSKSKAPREEWAQRLSCVRCFPAEETGRPARPSPYTCDGFAPGRD